MTRASLSRSIAVACLTAVSCSHLSGPGDDPQDPPCGNGMIDLGEECDDGNTTDWDGCTACEISDFIVNSITVSSQSYPVVAMSPSGHMLASWTSALPGTDGRAIRLRTVGVDGRLGLEDIDVLVGESSVPFPQVITITDDRFVLAHGKYEADDDDIIAHCLDVWGTEAGMGTWSSHEYSGSGIDPIYEFAMVRAPDGRWMVLWRDIHILLRGQYFDESCQPEGDDFPVSIDAPTGFQDAEIAMAGNGRFMVVWEGDDDERPAYSSDGIVGQCFTESGIPSSEAFILNTERDDSQRRPAIAPLADGGFVVTWESQPREEYRKIAARLFDEDCLPSGDEFRVDDTPDSSDSDPDIAASSVDTFVIVWLSSDVDGELSGISARVFDGSGAAITPEFQVNSYWRSSQLEPDVAMASDGRFAVVWYSDGIDGSYYGIVGQRFDPEGNPVGLQPW